MMKEKEVVGKLPANHELVVDVKFRYRKLPVWAQVEASVVQESSTKLRTSSVLFTDEHFQAILELPLSQKDREFVEFFRRRKNNPMTPTEWTKEGFAEKGRMDSINKFCIEHKLWIRFRTCGHTKNENWPDWKHAFFVMEEVSGRSI